MENFKHLSGPLRVRVIEPVKRTTRAYREEATIKFGISPSLPDSEDVFIDLLTGSSTGAVVQNTQATMIYDGEVYSGSRSYYALAEPAKNTFGYRCTTPTHQGRGAEQIYIPVLTKKHEQEKGLDRSKTVVFSDYFFDTTQDRSQINGCTVRGVYIKEAFDTNVCYDSKSNSNLEGLERGIERVGPNNVPYTVATITSNSVDGQPVSLVNLKAMYSIAKKYDIPMVTDSVRFAENTYFIEQRETEYRDWTIEQIIRETCEYVDMLAISAKEDTMMPMGGSLCMKDDSFFDVYTECRTLCMVQEGLPTYDDSEDSAMERLAVGLYSGMSLDWLAYHTAQVRCLVDGLKEIDAVCQQAGGHTVLADVDKLLSHAPADQFPARVLACKLYKVTGIRAVEIGSFLLDRDLKTGRQLPCPAELLRLTIPHAIYTQAHMDFIIEAFKHTKENAANIRRLTFTYEPRVLHHFTTKLKEV